MSDANAKPVAGASEPHELEERIAIAMWERHGTHDDWTELKNIGAQHQWRSTARAVLALVRQEQEKADAWATRELFGHWWLSHTAPQEK